MLQVFIILPPNELKHLDAKQLHGVHALSNLDLLDPISVDGLDWSPWWG